MARSTSSFGVRGCPSSARLLLEPQKGEVMKNTLETGKLVAYAILWSFYVGKKKFGFLL